MFINSLYILTHAHWARTALLDATLKLNGRSFKILQLLGEGGFSYVRPSSSSSLPHFRLTASPVRRSTSPRILRPVDCLP